MSRIEEFVQYHNGCDGECNGILLTAWADSKQLSDAERFNLAFFYAVVYNIPSAIFMLKEKDEILADSMTWCLKNKGKLIFQSDRRYMRCNNALEDTLEQFSCRFADGSEFLHATTNDNEIDTSKAIRLCQNWVNFGRFGAYLFVETLTYVMHLKSMNAPRFDFKHGATATSGVMNVFGFDCEADTFDKTRKIPGNLTLDTLDELLQAIAKAVEESGGDADYSCLETSLCAYRKFFKGTRYNGYYLDRQLAELVSYPEINPDSAEYINELYELRTQVFPQNMLGECCGWSGVRKDMKKYYLKHGCVNGYR